MGMQLGDSRSSGPRGDINVTPLVDVCLVLLIIFMVLIPQQVPEISVTIPPPPSRPTPRTNDGPLVVGLDRAGVVTLREQPVGRGQLESRLRRELEHRDRKAVFLDFDDDVAYVNAVAVLDQARSAGADVLAIVNPRGPTPTQLGTPRAPAPAPS